MASTQSKRPINQGKLLAGLVVVLIAGAIAINSFSSNASQDLNGGAELRHSPGPIGGGGGAASTACANKEGPCADSNSVWQLLKPSSDLSEKNNAFVISSGPLTFSAKKGYLDNLLGYGSMSLNWKEVVGGRSANRNATLAYTQFVRIGGYDTSLSAYKFKDEVRFINTPIYFRDPVTIIQSLYWSIPSNGFINYTLLFPIGSIKNGGKLAGLPLGIAYDNPPQVKLFDRVLNIDAAKSTPQKIVAYDSQSNQQVNFEMNKELLPLFPGINVTNITYSRCYLNYQCVSGIKFGSTTSSDQYAPGSLGVAGKTGPFFNSPARVNLTGYSSFTPYFQSTGFVGADYTDLSFGFTVSHSSYQAMNVSWYDRNGNLQVLSPQGDVLYYEGLEDIAFARKSSQKSIKLFSKPNANSTTVINDKVVHLSSIDYNPSTGTMATFYVGGRLAANPKAAKVTIGPLVTWRTAYLDVAGLNPINCTIQYDGTGIVVFSGGDSMGIDMDLKTGSCDLYPEQVPIGDAKYINSALKNPWLDLRNITALNNSTSLKCPFSTLAVVVHETAAYSSSSTIEVRPARPYANCKGSGYDPAFGAFLGWPAAFRKNSSGFNHAYLVPGSGGQPVDSLGMTPAGSVIDSIYDKWKSYNGINIYVADAVPKMNVTLRR